MSPPEYTRIHGDISILCLHVLVPGPVKPFNFLTEGRIIAPYIFLPGECVITGLLGRIPESRPRAALWTCGSSIRSSGQVKPKQRVIDLLGQLKGVYLFSEGEESGDLQGKMVLSVEGHQTVQWSLRPS